MTGISDGCICTWTSDSGSAGWVLKSVDPRCPRLGDAEHAADGAP